MVLAGGGAVGVALTGGGAVGVALTGAGGVLEYWALNAPPIETVKLKLHWCLRSQNRGFWVWPAQLDYSHIATTCISRDFTCISRVSLFWSLRGTYVNM